MRKNICFAMVILLLQAAEIEQRLLSDLLSDWGLVSELSALRNLFLLASPAAQVCHIRLLCAKGGAVTL